MFLLSISTFLLVATRVFLVPRDYLKAFLLLLLPGLPLFLVNKPFNNIKTHVNRYRRKNAQTLWPLQRFQRSAAFANIAKLCKGIEDMKNEEKNSLKCPIKLRKIKCSNKKTREKKSTRKVRNEQIMIST